MGERIAISAGLAIIASALAFFLALFVATFVLLGVGYYRHLQAGPGRPLASLVNMASAYRLVAGPVAIATLPIALIAAFWWQGRKHPRT